MAYPQTQPLGGFMAGMFQAQQQKDAEEQSRLQNQKSLQEMLFSQQEQPQKLANLVATGEHTKALTGQAQSTSKATDLANRMNGDTYEQRRQAFIDDAAAKHSLADIEARHRQNQLDLWSDDPAKVEAAKKKLENSAEVLKRKMELQMQANSAATVARINAQGKIDAKGAGGSGVTGWRGELTSAKGDPIKQFGVLAKASGDPTVSEEDKAAINSMMVALHPVANAALKNKAAPWGQDAQGNLVPNPAAQNPGIPAPVATTPVPTQSKYTAGQVYTDSKGIKRKYVGGDERDPKNWPEVK